MLLVPMGVEIMLTARPNKLPRSLVGSIWVLLWSIRIGLGLAVVFVLVSWLMNPDLNGDGMFTYRDALTGWAWVYHFPARLIMTAVAVVAPDILAFLEFGFGGSGLIWNLFTLAAWVPILIGVILYQAVSARVAIELVLAKEGLSSEPKRV
jgi:hypothetical protein